MKTFNNEITIASTVAERRNLANKIELLESKKLTELNNKINNSLIELQENYKELTDFSSPIVKNKKFFGLYQKTDIEASFNNILDCIRNLAECTLGAFQSNGENLEAVLELIKMTVVIENDLYKQLEDSDCSKEIVANLLHELCVRYNVDSKIVEGLFEQSFNRTITLRERIKDLRSEILSRISESEEKFEHLDEIISNKEREFIQQIENEIAEYNKQLEIRVKECKETVELCNNELNITKNSYKQEIEFTRNQLEASIKKYNEEVSEQLKNQIEVLSKNISVLQKRLIWCMSISGVAIITAVISLVL